MQLASRYKLAFFALGWLILLGAAFQGGAQKSIQRVYLGMEAWMGDLGQRLSEAEGKTLRKVRGTSRLEEMSAWTPLLANRDWLRQPDRRLYGAYDGGFPTSFSGFGELEQRLGYRFPIVSFYQAWGDKPDQQSFPARMVSTIDRLGSVPMITWEPWVKDFDSSLRPNLPDVKQREYASLAAIARGEYDFYVVAWARAAAEYGKPIFLRFGHEMNDPYRYPWGPQNGNRPEEFIAAWRHIHNLFQKMEATNVIWVWSPHISMPWFEYYYPGDEVVDWIGTGALNYGEVASWSRWWTFDQIFGKAYPTLAEFGKPIMICEFGSLTSGGDAAEWYEQAFADLEKYPLVESVVFFNQKQDVTLSTAPLDWSVVQSSGAVRVVSKHLADPS